MHLHHRWNHLRQHRLQPGDDMRRKRLQMHPGRQFQMRPGKTPGTAGNGSGSTRMPCQRSSGPSRFLLLYRSAPCQRTPRLDIRKPVFQPQKLGIVLHDGRPRDMAPDRRQGDAFLRMFRNGRHSVRNRPLPQGAEPQCRSDWRRRGRQHPQEIQGNRRHRPCRTPAVHMEGVGKNMIPSATDFSVIDRFVKVNDFESAHVARTLPLVEGLMCGYSSGAALAAVIKEIGKLPKDAVPVVLLPDHGERYMSKIFDDKWMEAQQWLNDITPEVKDFLDELKKNVIVAEKEHA